MNDYPGDKIRLKVGGSCLKQQNKLMYTHCKIVNIYIVYRLGASSSNGNDRILKHSFFGAVKPTKSADISKYQYFGYGTGFDRKSIF